MLSLPSPQSDTNTELNNNYRKNTMSNYQSLNQAFRHLNRDDLSNFADELGYALTIDHDTLSSDLVDQVCDDAFKISKKREKASIAKTRVTDF